MLYTTIDHDHMLACARDPRATREEREFLATQASLAAAREHVPTQDYLYAQALTGGALSTTTPIRARTKS